MGRRGGATPSLHQSSATPGSRPDFFLRKSLWQQAASVAPVFVIPHLTPVPLSLATQVLAAMAADSDMAAMNQKALKQMGEPTRRAVAVAS